jgi:pSer/pThr/pTyr-binding forkhead associated (FHA) protein
MAKLILKFENGLQKEVPLLEGTVSIGRLPDNTLPIDNPGISSRHCRVVLEGEQYFVEDNSSTNGTFVNKQRVTRVPLIHGDELTIGKLTIVFSDPDSGNSTRVVDAPAPRMDKTVMFQVGRSQEMSDMIKAGMAASVPRAPVTPAAPAAPKERIGMLTVLRGRTDQPQYVLARKLFLIGKSDAAGIRLKGFFAPKSAAVINRREGKYFVAPTEKSVKVKINQAKVGTQQELNDGDILEVASVKMTFSFND